MKISLIGLGNMGGRIAKRLIEQGYEIGVFDINKEVVNVFEEMGAVAFTSIKELGAHSQYVITVLPNADIVKEAVYGGDGLLEGMKSGSIVIDMTSSVPEVTKELGASLLEKGIHMLDAPVSGGTKKAEDGTLAIMVGGDTAAFDEVSSLLASIGNNIIHVGELGSGHTVKALNNLLAASTLTITAEALAVGVKMGIEPSKMLEVINAGSGRSASSETKFPQQVLTRNFEVGFTLDLMCKDLSIAMDISNKANAPMFASSAVCEVWKYALAQGGGKMDHTAIAIYIEEMSNVVIKD